MKKIVSFIKQHPYIIYIICLIPLIITNIYLYKNLRQANIDDLYIHRYLLAHGIYVNLLILFFGIMLANSLKDIINKLNVEFTILLKAIFFGLGCFFIYKYCIDIDFVLYNGNGISPKEPYYFIYTTTLSFCHLLLFYYFSFIIRIKFPKKEITSKDEKTIDDAIDSITSNTKSNKEEK